MKSAASIRKDFMTRLAFFQIQRKEGKSLNVNLELGTKLSFVEFLISQGEITEAEIQLAEASDLAKANADVQATLLEKRNKLAEAIQDRLRSD